jgi:integrase
MKLKENNNRYIKPEDHWIEELHQATGKVRIAIFLAIYAGLRKGEVATLKWTDIDLENCVIQLKTQNTKNEKYRQPAIPQFFKDELVIFRKTNPFGEYVLQGWNYHKIDREWRRFRNSLSFQYFTDARTGEELRITFHDLRHIHAFLLLNAGVSMIEIQHQLGHYSIRVTEDRYANVSSQIEQEKVDRLNMFPKRAGVN